MKNIVVFGAGKSATCLIDYLNRTCIEKNWSLTIGDANAEALMNRVAKSSALNPVQVNVENPAERIAIIQTADLVISLLPPALHILIARDCLANSKIMLTASYVDDEIRKLIPQIDQKKLLFLCEMGLDPGIDHMSAMQIIHRIQKGGGKIHTFRSHTGGLVAPESDDNPWHYKVSWNPANVVKAGSAGAIFREAGVVKRIEYQNLFEQTGMVEITGLGNYAWYPNRDSLAYIPLYGLESAVDFIRTTLRHPDFCRGWKNLVAAGLTDDLKPMESKYKTIADWSRSLLPFVNRFNQKMYVQLGLFEEDPLPAGAGTSAKILQTLIERNWKMKENDRDMVIMLHEFEYVENQQTVCLKSQLVVKGENALRTAMAKTVGLPLAIAAKLILEKKIVLHGLHIPVVPEIYEPVLKELEMEGIRFQEMIN
jgi:saccharopine dehydrogenase-like NADP-dependent oxidoreductase